MFVDLADDGSGHAGIVQRVLVDPVGCSRVGLDFHRLHELSRCPAPLDERFDLGASHRVSFDCGGVVHVVDPDRPQDLVRLDSPGKAAKLLVQ